MSSYWGLNEYITEAFAHAFPEFAELRNPEGNLTFVERYVQMVEKKPFEEIPRKVFVRRAKELAERIFKWNQTVPIESIYHPQRFAGVKAYCLENR